MARAEKVQAVADIKERIEGAEAVFLAEYSGLSVKEQQDLRRGLKQHGAEFKVVKMTLTKRAVTELEIDSLDDLLLGPTGLAFADDDPVAAAKVLADFAKDHEVFLVKGGLLGTEYLDPERIAQLASIESREALLAHLVGMMKSPMSNLAGLLVALPTGAASLLQQLIEKKSDEQEESDEQRPVSEEPEAPEVEASAEAEPGRDEVAEEDPAEEEPAAEASAGEEPAEEASAEEEPTEEPAEASAGEESAEASAVEEPAEEETTEDESEESADEAEEE